MAALKQVQQAKSDGYSKFKTNIGMTNPDLMDYIKTKVIKDYKGEDLALNIKSPESSKQ